MPALLLFVVAPLALAAVVFGAIYERKRAQQRREALSALALRMGFDFYPEKDTSLDERFSHFAVFRKGHSRAATNTMRGKVRVNGEVHPVMMGDYRYKQTEGSGKSRRTVTYRLSYLIVQFPRSGVPDLLIKPEGIFDKLGQALGFDDIDFEDFEFSKRFVVKSSDRRFAYDVCHPRMIEWLKAHASSFPAIDIERGQMCLATDKKRWSAAGFEGNLSYAEQFIDRWPDHLLRELGYAPSREGTAG